MPTTYRQRLTSNALMWWNLTAFGSGARDHQVLDETASAPPFTRSSSLATQWQSYLASLTSRPSIRFETAHAAQTLWTIMREATGSPLPPPAASPSEDGDLAFTWDKDRYHIGIEILAGNHFDWFFIDRQSDAFKSGKQRVGETLAPELVESFRRFAATQ